MKIREIISEGKNKLIENNVQDSGLQAKILMKYVLKESRKFFNSTWK